jgi:type II secretory pathway pseudopilin PulG
MVVVIVIAIIAAMALPSMSVMRLDRRTYDDAGSVLQLFRAARTRAVGRGTAVMVTITVNGALDRGTFQMYEAVAPNPTNQGIARTPVSSCKVPNEWKLGDPTKTFFVDGVNLNGPIDADADIQTKFIVYDAVNPSGASNVAGAICYTPLGRSYLLPGAQPLPDFSAVQPSVSAIELRVQRDVTKGGGGTTRSVMIPPNGMARLYSHG